MQSFCTRNYHYDLGKYSPIAVPRTLWETRPSARALTAKGSSQEPRVPTRISSASSNSKPRLPVKGLGLKV